MHVIDDEMKWDSNFGRSVLAGLLGLGANVGQVRKQSELGFVQISHFIKTSTPHMCWRGCWASAPKWARCELTYIGFGHC